MAEDKLSFGTAVKACASRVAAQLSTEKGQLAMAAVVASFLAAHQRARNPEDLERCTTESIAACVAASMATGLYPTATSNTPVYLVPQPANGIWSLEWRINHRGIATLAGRAGVVILAALVSRKDTLVVECGEVIEHRPHSHEDLVTFEDMAGAVVTVRTAHLSLRMWVPRGVIKKRREFSKTKSGSPWDKWPEEMACGAAIRYAYARGAIPVDSPELQMALAADNGAADEDDDVPAQAPTQAQADARARKAALGLPDHGAQREAEAEAMDAFAREREVVVVDVPAAPSKPAASAAPSKPAPAESKPATTGTRPSASAGTRPPVRAPARPTAPTTGTSAEDIDALLAGS